MRSRSPSTTLRLTRTVSPGENSGIVRPASNFSICCVSIVLSTVMASPLSSVLLPSPQIRAALARRPLPLLLPPLADPVVMTGEQHFRHRAAFPGLGPRVVRIFEEAVLETLLRERRLIPDHSRQQAHAGGDDRHRCRRAAERSREHLGKQCHHGRGPDHLVHLCFPPSSLRDSGGGVSNSPSGGSITTRPAATSTTGTTRFVNGMITGAPVLRLTSRLGP